MLVAGAISWKFTKKNRIALSTMDAEFISCYEASNHEIWLRKFVIGLRVIDGIDRSLKIYYDNNLVVLYSNNYRSLTRPKFIDIKLLVVKERIRDSQIFHKTY